MHNLLLTLALLVNVGTAEGNAGSDERDCSSGCEEERATAKIEHVFKAEDKGFGFISYQVTWRGHEVIVTDPVRWTDLAVGDTVRFIVIEHDMTAKAGGKKLLSFIVTKQ